MFTKKSNKKIQFYLILDYSLTKNDIIKSFLKNNIFLINSINSVNQIDNFGTYKIFNDLFDFKKILFLVSLIKIIYK
jgi:hypothetical protein